ncbi:MAG: hypothetical protein JST66_12220 [Bacteroidetes bacterium]|nr:hypothetical protein [Bacteroidota bacterium]
MRSRLLVVACLLHALAAPAQHPEMEAWMARHFGDTAGARPDRAADEALYAALGLDSLRSDRSIGQVEGEVRRADRSLPVTFVLWSDTLEAVLRFWSPGDTTTYAADLRTNTITIVTTGTDGAPHASVNDLRERVVVNWYRYKDDGSPWRVTRKVPYSIRAGILYQNMERWTVVQGDTIRFTRRGQGRSPFLDALEWLPYGGDGYPFDLFMRMARAGDPMPNTLQCAAGRIAVHAVSIGPRPRPSYRLGDAVTDTRTEAHHPLPSRRSNARASVVELDPVVAIPPGQEHHWATADPGRPDAPEETWSGPRSRLRVHAKTGCGAAGTVVVKVWIDRKGLVQRAEVDPARSTLRTKACLDNALEAARQDTFYPMEGAMPLDAGEFIFTYK